MVLRDSAARTIAQRHAAAMLWRTRHRGTNTSHYRPRTGGACGGRTSGGRSSGFGTTTSGGGFGATTGCAGGAAAVEVFIVASPSSARCLPRRPATAPADALYTRTPNATTAFHPASRADTASTTLRSIPGCAAAASATARAVCGPLTITTPMFGGGTTSYT